MMKYVALVVIVICPIIPVKNYILIKKIIMILYVIFTDEKEAVHIGVNVQNLTEVITMLLFNFTTLFLVLPFCIGLAIGFLIGVFTHE